MKKVFEIFLKVLFGTFLTIILAPIIILPLAGEGLLNPVGSLKAKNALNNYVENKYPGENLKISYPRENIKDGSFYANVKDDDKNIICTFTYHPESGNIEEN